MKFDIDITPKTHLIASTRRTDMAPWLAISELIDNSIDAESDQVLIDWDAAAKCLSVADNGAGAPNPSSLVRIGDSDPISKSPTGRCGVGTKDAIGALGMIAEVSVVRGGMLKSVYADFEEIRLSGKWTAKGEEREACSTDTRGTTLKILKVDRRFSVFQLVEKLSKVFAPTLRNGCAINFNGEPLTPPPVVRVTDRREGGGFFEGKAYSWWAGIMVDGQSVNGGWRTSFGPRMLEEDSCNRSYGTGAMDIHKFYGEMTLEEPNNAEPHELWNVNKNKTRCQELQDLLEAVYPEVSELLERCAQEHSLTLEASMENELSKEITQSLNETVRMRERRKLPEEKQPGTVIPSATGRKRQRASKTQEGNGSILCPNSGTTFAIKFLEDDAFGHVTGNRKANVIYLGRLHPFWQIFKDNKDVVRSQAMGMLVAHAVTTEDNDQPIMSFRVQCESAHTMFFETIGKIALQIAASQACEAAS